MPFETRKSNRLKHYDYGQNGAYFVTITVQKNLRLFGEIINQKMILNEAGKMIQKLWLALEQKFLNTIFCDEFIVMPDHFHGIIIIDTPFVGTNLCVCPDELQRTKDKKYKDKKHLGRHQTDSDKHIGLSLPTIIQWFKTMTTNAYIRGVRDKQWLPFDKKLWLRSFYDHIIRNEESLQDIRKYIIENPLKYPN